MWIEDATFHDMKHFYEDDSISMLHNAIKDKKKESASAFEIISTALRISSLFMIMYRYVNG